jgi:hypothetical protein
MISDQVSHLVQDIFLQMRTPAVHQEVKEDPEAYLLSLLQEIKDDLSGHKKFYVPLYNTVERASFQSHLEKAREGTSQPASHE